jgi:hypothetical protein
MAVALALVATTWPSVALARSPAPAPGDAEGATPPAEDAEDAEDEDDGRGLDWLWLDAGAGITYANLAGFSAENLGVAHKDSFGPAFDVGFGVRIIVASLGLRARASLLDAFTLWQLGGEAGVRIPIGRVDLNILARGGYTFVGALTGRALSSLVDAPDANVRVRGWYAGATLGFACFLHDAFSIGLDVTGDALVLRRPPVKLPADLPDEVRRQIETDPLYKESGTSIGLGITGLMRLGVHL